MAGVSVKGIIRPGWPTRGARTMSLLRKLLSWKSEPVPRVRICVECGMPVADHKDWCSIYRTRRELDREEAAAK
jgi:hypothetical protein